MSPIILALLGIVTLLVLMFIRMPISFAMMIVGYIGLTIVISPQAANTVLSADLWSQFTSYSLTVIPLFILMGEVVYRTGIAEKLFYSAYTWVGHFRGGMASTTILASAIFGSISGSNSATTATIGTMAFPELDKYKYNNGLSAGSIATGGTLGVLIPPSTVLIVLALQMGQSVKELFLASIIPGLLLICLLVFTIILICRRNPELGPAGRKMEIKERILSLKGVFPIAILFLFVIGGLFLGWFTPTESAAFGAFGAIVLALVMRKLTIKKLVKAMENTLRTTIMVWMLIIGAVIFGRFLTVTRLPYDVATGVSQLAVPAIVILISILLIFIIGGAFMDSLGFLMIAIPIFYPTVLALGYDPVWFAVVLCAVTSLGAITPPVGVNVFIVQGLKPNLPVTTVFKGTSYFLIPYFVFIGILIMVPQLVLFIL